MEAVFRLGRDAYMYAFREPVCLWFNARADNKFIGDQKLNGFAQMGEEYAKLVESVSREIGSAVGLTKEQMDMRGTTVLYPFDMTALPDKRKKIQNALREHLPKLRRYDPDIMGLLGQLERARYAKEPE